MQKKQSKNAAAHLGFIMGVLLLCSTQTGFASDNQPLLRFPDIHDNTMVFVHGEDIWSVPANGGVATRLTMNDGAERYPKFSPDGNLIAFTGEYDGNRDVYVMNAHGGQITRVTYHPRTDQVVGWHPTKNKILFSSSRKGFYLQLFLISPDGTGLEELILHESAAGSFSPDGKKIAFNKVSRENRTWKRYTGGLAQEVYLYDFEKNEIRNLTNFRGTDRIPMWVGDEVYFSSDRNRTLNIYAYDTKSDEVEQITHHTDYDVRRPSKGGNQIVYELGGALWLLNTSSKETKQIPVEIRMDAPEVRPRFKKVDKNITGIDCSAAGERAVIVARGEVFTVPPKDGSTRNLTKSSGARDKDAAWSPDGKWIAYISDQSGEYEVYLTDPMGKTKAQKLTSHKNGYRHTLRWSPDSKKIAYADQTLRCYYIDIATRKIVEVDRAEYENVDVSLDLKPIYDFSWSPDSRFLAYSKMNADLVMNLHIYSLQTDKSHNVSNGLFNDFGPVFSKDGRHLLFISNRRFNPTFDDFEWEMVYKNVAGVYCLTLREDGQPLLPLKKDEAKVPSTGEGKKKDSDAAVEVVIDFDGVAERIEALPLEPGNYRNLAVNKSSVFYLNKDKGDFNRFEFRGVGVRTLYAFSFEDRKQSAVIEDIDDYKLSSGGSHIVYKKNNSVGIIKSTETDSKGKTVGLAGLQMMFEPRAEWKQIFYEAWRFERDFYYDPDMHGLDWDAMKDKYGALMSGAVCRQDVRFIIGELIGELNTSHTYVFGGDLSRKADRVNVGMLGVDWNVDNANNRYRFGKIHRAPDWTREVIPPLARPGVNVRDGEYLLAVNGVQVAADRNIYSYFQNLANKQVTLTVNSKPSSQGAREVTVKPLRDEGVIRYIDWVEHNRKVVADLSDGRIGYLHLPDTYTGSAREFPKYFYAQTRKKGIVVDGRFNRGGLDPDIFLQRLNKKLHVYWTRRYSHDQTTPAVVTQAHLVCLTNRQAGSGGDMLPMEFKMLGMGPVIGTRTWGGLVGVSMFVPMIDGGGVTAPDYRIYDKDGKWIVENVGVEPDITVELHPAEMAEGKDAQLLKGVEVLLKKIKEEPRQWPKHAPFQVGSKKAD